MGGATVTLTLNEIKKHHHHHHHSKSTPASPTHPRYCYGDLQQRQSSEPRKRGTLMPSQRSSPISCGSVHSDSKNSQGTSQEMKVPRKSQELAKHCSKQRVGQIFEVSPFSRSRSRIFYASDDLWSQVMDSPAVPSSPSSSFEDDSSNFDRSCNRGSSGRKSHDSGFSDSGEVNSGQSPQLKMHHQPSAERKPQKWSSSFPIKAFLKSHDFTEGHLPKLSMLKCCIGIDPAFYLHSKQRKVESMANGKVDKDGSCTIKNEVQDSTPSSTHGKSVLKVTTHAEVKQSSDCDVPTTPCSSQNSGEGMGTWPRIRKNKTLNAPFSVPPKPNYQSTRLRKHSKSRERTISDGSQRSPEQDASQSNLNERIAVLITNPSLHQWSKDLQFSTEDECMNTLQSKTVARNVADIVSMASMNAKDTVLEIHFKHKTIALDLMKLKRKIDKEDFLKALQICNRITSNVENFLWTCRSHEGSGSSIRHHCQSLVEAQCKVFTHHVERSGSGNISKQDWFSLQDTIHSLASSLSSVTDDVIQFHVKNIVDVLEEPPNLFSLSISVNTVEILATYDARFCHDVALTGGIRALLTICIDPKYRAVRARALRCLATLCCIWDSVKEMENCGGVECVTDILTEGTSTEEEKREAAGFIAQITSPSLENSHHISGLAENISSLIRSLTDLAKSTKASDSFLLATAALGNLTFLTHQACMHLLKCKTVEMLVSTCRRVDPKAGSVFVKDQIATILANMCNSPEGKTDVLNSGGLIVLLGFLQMRPCMAYTKAELTACERVQQKSAIALSRLCSEAAVSEKVIELQGVQRLIRLCKEEKERNHSDAVLVACLAVLRKIATACGFEEFKDLDAMELVKPRLLDTFLIYSSRQESYV